MRRTRIAAVRVSMAACLSILCVLGMTPETHAQTRLEVLSQDTVPGSNLRMLTIRDNQLSACFTVFIQESSAAPAATQTVVPEPTPADDAKRQSIDRIRAAAASREQELNELKEQFKVKTGRAYEDWLTPPPPLGAAGILSSVPVGLLPGWPVGTIPTMSDLQAYDRARREIDNEYEFALRSEIVGSYPFVRSTPGITTGGFEDQANAMRRGMLDPDPTSMMQTMLEKFAQLDAEVRSLAEAPRLAASGPFACPGTAETSKPAR